MRYYTRRPAPPLSDCVIDLWLYTGYRPDHAFERILPTGTVEIVINLRDSSPLRCYDSETFALAETVHGPLVSGARARYCMVDTAQQEEIMGVQDSIFVLIMGKRRRADLSGNPGAAEDFSLEIAQ